MKYLKLFNKIAERGELPGMGLCMIPELGTKRIFKLLDPTDEDTDELLRRNQDSIWWASEKSGRCGNIKDYAKWRHERYYKFTGLRQTILLFCAAINNEL